MCVDVLYALMMYLLVIVLAACIFNIFMVLL